METTIPWPTIDLVSELKPHPLKIDKSWSIIPLYPTRCPFSPPLFAPHRISSIPPIISAPPSSPKPPKLNNTASTTPPSPFSSLHLAAPTNNQRKQTSPLASQDARRPLPAPPPPLSFSSSRLSLSYHCLLPHPPLCPVQPPPQSDGARRHHRPADPGEADPGSRLGVPPGARGQHDAAGWSQRHRGILPLDTIESIWRVIISTFTYVQAPFSVHADVSVGEPAMRDWRGFISASSCPTSRISARRRRWKRWRNRRATWRWSRQSRAARRGGSRWRRTARQKSSPGCRSSNAPIIRPHSRCS